MYVHHKGGIAEHGIISANLATTRLTMMMMMMMMTMIKTQTTQSGPDFAGAGPRANIENGSSLIIHWSSGSHKKINELG